MLEYLAPLMFAGLVVFLLLGYPVAFSLAFTGLAFALLGIELGVLQPALLVDIGGKNLLAVDRGHYVATGLRIACGQGCQQNGG